MHPYIAEALGTCLLVLFGNGVVASTVLKKSKGREGSWMAITIGWGLAVMIAVYAVARFSEAHLNPAITLALASHGAFSWTDVPGYIFGQCTGALTGALLIYSVYYPHLAATKDTGRKLACFSTTPAIHNPPFNFLAEVLATALLVFGVLSISANAEWLHSPLPIDDIPPLDFADFFIRGLRPLLLGLLVMGIGLSFGGLTGYALNPARDLIPRLLHAILPIPGKGSSRFRYAWVPVLGPIVGAYLGLTFHKFCQTLFL